MKHRTLTSCIFVFILAAGLMLGNAAFAQQNTESGGEDTMTMVGENQRPEDIDNRITLPETAAKERGENSEFGLNTAKQAREQKREFGMEKAREARQNNVRDKVQDRVRDRIQQQDQVRDRIHEQDRVQDQDAIKDRIPERN